MSTRIVALPWERVWPVPAVPNISDTGIRPFWPAADLQLSRCNATLSRQITDKHMHQHDIERLTSGFARASPLAEDFVK